MEPSNADAYNYLGYANRKLGKHSEALMYYQKALSLEPEHLGANEYLGELYLEMKQLPQAEERLAVLQNACGDCEEYEDLKAEIEEYKAKQQS
jgi:tetratricopeptide (TPR) repeat protein